MSHLSRTRCGILDAGYSTAVARVVDHHEVVTIRDGSNRGPS